MVVYYVRLFVYNAVSKFLISNIILVRSDVKFFCYFQLTAVFIIIVALLKNTSARASSLLSVGVSAFR